MPRPRPECKKKERPCRQPRSLATASGMRPSGSPGDRTPQPSAQSLSVYDCSMQIKFPPKERWTLLAHDLHALSRSLRSGPSSKYCSVVFCSLQQKPNFCDAESTRSVAACGIAKKFISCSSCKTFNRVYLSEHGRVQEEVRRFRFLGQVPSPRQSATASPGN